MTQSLVATLLRLLLISLALLSSAGNTDDADGRTSRSTKLEIRNLLRSASGGIDDGDFKEARTFIDSILAINPSHPDAFFLKGKILLIEGDSLAAIEVLREATQIAPRSTRLKLLLARIYLNLGNWEKSLTLTEEVLLIKPSDGEATYLNGWGLLMSGDSTTAAEKLEPVLKSKLTGKKR